MAELADALALGASGATHGGSSPSLPTTSGRQAGALALGASGVTHGGSSPALPTTRGGQAGMGFSQTYPSGKIGGLKAAVFDLEERKELLWK